MISRRNIVRLIRQIFAVFQYSGRALELVWNTSRTLTVILAILTVVAGLLPAAIAYIGKLIVDSVILAAQSGLDSDSASAPGYGLRNWAFIYLGLEAIVVAILAGSQRGLSISQSLLRVLLGQKVNVLILEKALTLDLTHFEDSEFYDKMSRARREASSRPLSLVSGTFKLVQDTISLATYGGLLLKFSGWVVVVLILAAIPAFIAETKFAGVAFRLFRWRAPETREQTYLETLIAREDFAKEVQLYGLGAMLLQRYLDKVVKIITFDFFKRETYIQLIQILQKNRL
jgi:ATP-binding cassette, subfamily B, bacterial